VHAIAPLDSPRGFSGAGVDSRPCLPLRVPGGRFDKGHETYLYNLHKRTNAIIKRSGVQHFTIHDLRGVRASPGCAGSVSPMRMQTWS
jgi:hypothetical protein